jgi:hypothetical protein
VYKWYRAWVGVHSTNRNDHINAILDDINDKHEEIVSVTAVGLDNVWVLIITKKPLMETTQWPV